MLLNVEGISCSLDPVLQEWLAYSPSSRATQTRELKVELNLELAKAASPLQANMSQSKSVSKLSHVYNRSILSLIAIIRLKRVWNLSLS